MKLKVSLTIYAPGDHMFIGGTNPPILDGSIELDLTPKLILALSKGYITLDVTDVNWQMFAKILSAEESGDDVSVVATTHLPKENPLDAIRWLVKEKGFALDKDAAKLYERSIGSVEQG